MTAGHGFGYNRDVHLLPHRRPAWVFFAERLRDVATAATRLRTRSGVPREVEEAVAALQSLATQFAQVAGTWNAESEAVDFAAIETQRSAAIEPELNGPFLVSNVENLVNSRGEHLQARPEMALCRCGGSANKPFCDGTHARIGFMSAKHADRTADRRDTYVGRELTIYDNRGICQHAGYWTDNLRAVFRLNEEPFVEPNGAGAQAIIAQIKQCPSGALSYSIGGIEDRDQQREPAVLVSKNGPYRIAGGIALGEAAWGEGASREHYPLCRCGGSKNKPFCDGSHWSQNFTDDKN